MECVIKFVIADPTPTCDKFLANDVVCVVVKIFGIKTVFVNNRPEWVILLDYDLFYTILFDGVYLLSDFIVKIGGHFRIRTEDRPVMSRIL